MQAPHEANSLNSEGPSSAGGSTPEKLSFIGALKTQGCEREEARSLFEAKFGDSIFEFPALWFADSVRSQPEPAGPRDLEREQDGTLFTVPEAAMPSQVVMGSEGKCYIPKDFGKLAFMFGVKSRARHVVTTDEAMVTVGDKKHQSLRTVHARVMFAIFYELQKRVFPFRHQGVNEDYLELDISIRQLYATLNPDSVYGGAAKERLLMWLKEMVTTPIRIESLATGAVNQCTLLHSCERLNEQHVYRVRVSPYFTRPYLSARGQTGSKEQLKPFYWGVFRGIRSPYARPTYLHLDWALSHHHKAEISFEKILRRAGAMEANDDGASVAFTSQQRERLRSAMAELDGLGLSSGETLFIHEATLQGNHGRKLELKLVASKKKYDRIGEYGGQTYRVCIQSVEFYDGARVRAISRRQSKAPPGTETLAA